MGGGGGVEGWGGWREDEGMIFSFYGQAKIQTQKGSNECLFIVTQTHGMHIFREIPFIKPQNDT